LHGVENACGFIYRINISLPTEIIDNAAAIEAYFQRQLAESKLNQNSPPQHREQPTPEPKFRP
jgi:hypothetical protein